MASPQLRPKTRVLVPRDWSSESAALRLLSAERPEEIFPILLEEIVKLGFARALVLEVDFETGEIKPAASLNCDKACLHKFRTSLWASENPVVSALQNLQPSNLDALHGFGDSWYAYPMIYRSASRCWEAERERRQDCLALQNFRASKKLQFEEQVCHACGMQGYATLVLAELQNTHPQKHLERLHAPTQSKESVRTGMVTVMRDVTDLRRADEEVRANLEKLRAAEEMVRQDRDRVNLVIENVGDPIIVADNSAKIVLLDPMAKELFGSAEPAKDPQIVKNQAKLDAYLNSFTFSFADKENRSVRLYNPGSGAEVEYAARSGKIYDARGQVAYTVTVLRDFSAWKKLEQLQMERRMLEMEKFAATGRLAGTIAHEINNPLEAMKNAIHLLSGKLDPQWQPIFESLRTENERVTRIVRQMLGLYRNTAPLGSFDLNSVVEDTLALFARPMTKAGIEVQKRLGELPPMKGSADQFRQLLSNLVVNARDSLHPGGKLIIKTQQVLASDGLHGWVKLSVADTGSGIARDLQKSMFEPFVSTKGEKGTGLGLWIVKGIVENHNGRIRVRSRAGKGTVFSLTFPVVRPVPVSPLS